MEEEFRKFLNKTREYKLPSSFFQIFKEKFNKESNAIIYYCLEYNVIDVNKIFSDILQNIQSFECLITLAISLRYNPKITEDNYKLIQNHSLREDILLLLNIKKIENYNKGDINTIAIFNIFLNKKDFYYKFYNVEDYNNIIISHSNIGDININDGDLLKQTYRCYNYNRFVEMIDHGIYPDYIMLTDIIITINLSKDILKTVLINMLKYFIKKTKTKIDEEQYNLLFRNLNTSSIKENYTIYYNDKSQVIRKDNKETDEIFEIEIDEEFTVINRKIQNDKIDDDVSLIISEEELNIFFNKMDNIIYNLIGKRYKEIDNNIGLYSYKNGTVLLTEKHSLITYLKDIENSYEIETKKIIKKINNK